MRAVTFQVSIPRYLAVRALGRVRDRFAYGVLGGLRYGQVALPELPGPQWARLRVLGCGICGTDLGNIHFASSPALEPFASFPAVLGHEILAEVEEVGRAVTRVEPGMRVSVDPMISCGVRGYDRGSECPSCASGLHSTCERAGEEGLLRMGERPFAPGITQGYHRDLPGGWGERTIAHESQLFPLPEGLDDRAAVLVEPLSIGMHAVLRTPPRPEELVLVIGSGPIALATIWALRATGFEGFILGQAKRKHEITLARRLGASDVVRPGDEAREAIVGTGASAYQPILGDEVYAGGGFPLIFDCVGSRSSLGQALRYASPRGRIVLLGCAAEMKKLDLTFVWARELEVRGFVGYGRERWRGEERHTFEITQELLRESGAPVGEMVTHRFPLHEYRDALAAASNHRVSGAVKVVLGPSSYDESAFPLL